MEMKNDTLDEEEILREKMKEFARGYLEKGDFYGWFDAIYRETEDDSEQIPWVDNEPNKFLVEWDKSADLQGNGEKALVVGCGLGDDAVFLDNRGFDVTAFDVSEKAIEIARKVHADTDIEFVAADLFDPPEEFRRAFDLVLEVYTIQALPLDLRERAIDAIARFVADNGRLIVIQRLRADDEEAESLPWPLSRKELKRFGENGLTLENFTEFESFQEDDPVKRFVAEYGR
jgi:ubiquinone/menaquinone biosynthesis C-methylase UbiE